MKNSHLSSIVGFDDPLAIVEAAKRDMRKNPLCEKSFYDKADSRLVLSEQDKSERRKADYIDSDTFKPTGRELGYGCWGSVDEYLDSVGNKWAIKIFCPNETAARQMKERRWTAEDVMRREAIPIYAAHRHVVPRIIERDKKGRMYVAMPVYERDLSDKLYNLNLNQALKLVRDVVDALSYAHEQKYENGERSAHGDVKPSNIFIEDGRAFLSDWGSQTCISIGGTGSLRGPHGDKNYRAPECFEENARPSSRADVWSLGAILYEAIAKEGIYDGLSDAERGKQYIISQKIRKKIPRPIRKFLEKSLSIDPDKRYADGIAQKQGLEKAIKKYEKTALTSRLKRYGVTAAVATIIAGTLASFFSSNKEVKGLEKKVFQLNGDIVQDKRQRVIDLYLQREGKEGGINFSYSYDMFIEDGKLTSALFKFKDKKVGIAAYIDPSSVFASMMDAGIDSNDTSFGYEKIESFLKERNSEAYWEIWEREHIYYDNFILRTRANKYENFEKEWVAAKQTYEQEKIEKELAKKRELEEQRKRKETHEIAIRIK